MEESQQIEQLKRFVLGIALLTKEGESMENGTDEEEDDAFVWENDDAFETLQSLISEAREIAKGNGW